MVNVLINEIQDTISVFYSGPYTDGNVRLEEQHEFSRSDVDFFWTDNNRWVLQKKMQLGEFEHKYVFDFPAQEVYIRYIRED